MTKKTDRILSIVLAVLLTVSMISVFSVPAFAETSIEAEEVTDYEALFEGAFLIDPNWDDKELVTDRVIQFTYRGETREVVCDATKHFNSLSEAMTAAYSKDRVNAANIYTYNPVFIVAPGTYSDVIHIPGNATIIGANAGISPNAELSEEDWTVDAVEANGGWKANTERDTANETIFTGGIQASTRTGSSYNSQPATGADDERFAYFLQAGKAATGGDPRISVTIDGVKVQMANTKTFVTMHHYDYSQPLLYPANGTQIINTSGRHYDITIKNCDVATGTLVYANNGAHNIVHAYVQDSALHDSNAQFFQRDIQSVEMDGTYVYNVGSSWSLWNNSNLVGYNLVGKNGDPASKSYADDYGKAVNTVIKNSMFYNIASNTDRAFGIGAWPDRNGAGENSTTYTHEFTDNIFYNARAASSTQGGEIIKIMDVDRSSRVKVTVTDNQFYQDGRYVYNPVNRVANHKSAKDALDVKDNVVEGMFVTSDIDSIDPVDFNKDLKDDGITLRGVTFTAEDTAVYAPRDAVLVTQGSKQFFVSFFGNVKYKFTIDNENVFPNVVVENHLRMDALEENFKGKNIILPVGSYENDLDFSFGAYYYGADFGVSPIDKTHASAANNYDWELNKEFGMCGYTTVRTTKIMNDITEDLTLDGVWQKARLWDDQRKSDDTNPINVTYKNIYYDDDSTAYTAGGYIYNMHNSRNQNGTGGTINSEDFGKKYADSFTLQNVYFAQTGGNGRIINEYVPAITTIDNIYVDCAAAYKGHSVISFFKQGIYNTNSTFTVKNSNFRNGYDGNPVLCFETFSSSTTKKISADRTMDIVVYNNIFYNCAKSTGAAIRVRPALITGLDVQYNKFIRNNGATGYAVAVEGTSYVDASTAAIAGNITVNANEFIGYDGKQVADFGLGANNPVITNTDGHVYDNGTEVDSGSCKVLNTIVYTCKGCDYDMCDGYQKIVTSTKYGEHHWTEGTYNNDETCQNDGTKTAECTICHTSSNAVTVPGTKLSHKYENYELTTPATCITAGKETGTCSLCDTATHTRTNAKKYPATGVHTWGEYTYNNDATAQADGTKTAKCTVSGCTAKNTVTAEGTKLPSGGGEGGEGGAPAVKPVDSSKKFKDVDKNGWYKKAVDHAVTYGLISGMSETEFGVGTKVTRGMFITILARMAGVDTDKNDVKTKFTDVASGKYYTAAIKWASEAGIVSGVADKKFAPDDALQRQQLAVMIVNFAKYQKVAITAVEDAVKFADASAVYDYAKDAVAVCQKADIINGYNEGGKLYFKPTDTATREQAAQMLYVFHNNFYLAK